MGGGGGGGGDDEDGDDMIIRWMLWMNALCYACMDGWIALLAYIISYHMIQ